ncbi:hypothetical protein IV454_09075 [Massilia antarctica]|uniref:Uncharacterized protein n=1 Tax=Massilia antarctica TaxID=2765360 RepID=A0AA48WH31_9BURK|nr:hypothetical protein [Massilia antarctica]QPI51628.1 hypothetical protein IV454_09075 [Massilia antarctica]
MRLVSPEEAQSLFAASLFCDECSDWMPWNLQPTTVVSTAGVMKEDGSSAMLIVELLYTRTHKTKKIEYRFTVFRRQIWGNDPVYPPVSDYLSGVFLNKLCPDLDRCGGV